VLALLRRHTPVAGGRRGPDLGGAPAERLFRLSRQSTEAHAGDRERNVQAHRLTRVSHPDHDVGGALLSVTLEWIARYRGAEEQQIVAGDTCHQ